MDPDPTRRVSLWTRTRPVGSGLRPRPDPLIWHCTPTQPTWSNLRPYPNPKKLSATRTRALTPKILLTPGPVWVGSGPNVQHSTFSGTDPGLGCSQFFWVLDGLRLDSAGRPCCLSMAWSHTDGMTVHAFNCMKHSMCITIRFWRYQSFIL